MKQLHINFQNVLIAIIVLSGTFNNFFNAYLFPINFTLIVLLIVLLDSIYNFFTRRIRVSKVFILVLLLILMFYTLVFISLFYSPSTSYKYTKTINFTINLLLFTYPIFIREIKLDKIIKIIKFLSIALAIFFIYERYRYWLPSNFWLRGQDNNHGFFVFSVIYLGIGVNLSLVIIYESFKRKWIWIIFLMGLLIGMGSRGSLLFSIITITAFHYKYFIGSILKFKLKKKQLYVASVIIIIVSALTYKYFDKVSEIVKIGIGRFQSLLNFAEDKSTLGRLEHYSITLKKIFSNPLVVIFGFGIGSYGLIVHNQDIRWYPHNIFLEAWFELGVIGMLILILILFISYFGTKGKQVLKAMFLFLFLEAMKSSNITDLWVFFLIIGILLVYKDEIKVN